MMSRMFNSCIYNLLLIRYDLVYFFALRDVVRRGAHAMYVSNRL